jgi:hypothetical protein
MAKIRRLASGIVIVLVIGGPLLAADVTKTSDSLPPAGAKADAAADTKTVAQASDSKTPASDTKIVVPLPPPPPPPPPVVYEAPAGNWLDVHDCRGARLKTDVGFMVLTPRWNSNPALAIVSGLNGAAIPSAEVRDFDFNAQFVPTVSLGGVLANGVGARVNWWGFVVGDHVAVATGAPDTAVIPPNAGAFVLANMFGSATALTTAARLHMDVWDFELTDDVRLSRWAGLVALGVRYAHLSQEYSAATTDVTPAGPLALLASHNFNGAGPTLALELHRDLGLGGLYFYGYGRGSVLFGSATERSDIQSPSGALGFTDLSTTAQRQPVLPVGEIDFGLGWNRALRGSVLYAQVGFVGQVWWGAGSPTSEASALSTLLGDSGTRNDNLGLIGLSFRTGVNF